MSIYLSDPYYFAHALATLVLAVQIAGVGTLFALLFFRKSTRKWLGFLARNSTLLAFIVAVTAVSGSLIFSDVFEMNPCKLCWFQRIVIFPQVVLLGMALWKKHQEIIADYSIAFACISIPISIFHYLLQMTDAPAVHAFAPCDVTGQAPSCTSYYILMYDYITIPMMALTAASLILLLMVLGKMRARFTR